MRKLSINQQLKKLNAGVTQLSALNEALIGQMKANTIALGILMTIITEKGIISNEELQAKFDEANDKTDSETDSGSNNGD